MHINVDLYENIDDIQDIIDGLFQLKAKATSINDVDILNTAIDILEEIITENEY